MVRHLGTTLIPRLECWQTSCHQHYLQSSLSLCCCHCCYVPEATTSANISALNSHYSLRVTSPSLVVIVGCLSSSTLFDYDDSYPCSLAVRMTSYHLLPLQRQQTDLLLYGDTSQCAVTAAAVRETTALWMLLFYSEEGKQQPPTSVAAMWKRQCSD